MPRTFRTAALVVPIVAAMVALAGCASDEPVGADAATSESAGDPVSGGTLTVAQNAGVNCIDPLQSTVPQVINTSRNFVDTLTDQDPDTGEIVPWLAESWEISADATAFTFYLRDDVSFSDGTPLTAEVVKANFDRIAELGPARTSTAGSVTSGYTGSEVLDEHTVVITFEEPNVPFLQGTSEVPLGIFALATTTATVEDRCQGDLIGSGPFTIESFDADAGLTIVRRDDYDWGSPLRGHDGAAYLDKIVFEANSDAGVRSGRLQSGEIDLDSAPLTENLAAFEGNGFQVIARTYPGIVRTWVPNVSRPITADKNVRLALSYGIDREGLHEGVLSTYEGVAYSLFSSTTPLYTEFEQADYDPDRAIELLEDSGWESGDDGIRVKDGERLVIVVTGDNTVNQAIQTQLRAIGIEVQLKSFSSSELATVRQEGDYDVWSVSWYKTDPDVLRTLFWYAGSNAAKVTEARPVDTLLEEQRTLVDESERKAVLDEAVADLIAEGYGIPIHESAAIYTASDRVHGVYLDSNSALNLFDAWKSGE